MVDISQQILWKDKMVTTIDISIMFQDSGVTTCFSHRTDTGGLPYPTCQRGIKELHIDLAHVLTDPFVKDGAGKMSVLLRRDSEISQPGLFFCNRSEAAAISMRNKSFYNRCKLNVTRPEILEKMIDFERIVRIIVVHNSHYIPLNIVLF